MAKLYFKYGAMNSGKSTILLQTAHNYEERGMKVLVIKPSIDLKDNNQVSSRLGIKRQVDYLISPTDNIINKLINLENISCILVDEAQFLTPYQVDELMKITIIYDIPVICYGLRTDFKSKGFQGSTRLLEIAHNIEEMRTICRCGEKAIFTARFLNNKRVEEGEQVAIDGLQNITYESMCPKCFYQNKLKLKK